MREKNAGDKCPQLDICMQEIVQRKKGGFEWDPRIKPSYIWVPVNTILKLLLLKGKFNLLEFIFFQMARNSQEFFSRQTEIKIIKIKSQN